MTQISRPLSTALSLLAALALAAPAPAQWSPNPATNLLVDDSSGEQVQPKVAAAPGGGWYVSWYDSDPSGSPPFGYDVRLQKLDAAGNELWAAGGVLIADRGFSSTQDYGLAVDAAGNALLAFRDDRPGGTQITATKVDGTGTQVWGASGVQLTATADFVAAPKVAGTTDGHAVVAWTQGSNVRLQRLDAGGVPQWAGDVVLVPPSGSYSASDVQVPNDSTVIIGFVRQIGGTRNLLAQRLDASGALLWGAAHVAVFDGGSLQFGNFPTFLPDPSGGAVFTWYGVSPLQCYVQRVTAAGAELLPHNGVTVSTDATRVRVNPSIAWDPATSTLFAFWIEQNSLQSQFGVYAQRFDAMGNRQWGSTGAVLVPVGTTQLGQVQGQVHADGAQVFWVQGPSFGSQSGIATRLDGAGAIVRTPFAFSSVASSKSRLASARSTLGDVALAWQDQRLDGGGIYAQDVTPDGSLGPGGIPFCFGSAGACPCANVGSPTAGCDNAQSTGGVELALAAILPNGAGGGTATFSGTGFPPASAPTVVGIRAPGRETPPVAFGDGLRCVGVAGLVRFGATAASGGSSTHVTSHGAGAGSFHYQLWYRNTPATFCDPTAAFNLSNGLTVVWP